MLAATPTKTLRRPDGAPKGIAIKTTTRQVHGAASRACHWVLSISALDSARPGCNLRYSEISLSDNCGRLAAWAKLRLFILISLRMVPGLSESSGSVSILV